MSAAPALSRESRWLRLAGVAIIVISIAAFAFYEDALDAQRFLAGDRAAVTKLALAFVAYANVFALGFVLLLAGLRDLSLITSAGARRGALARMGAANLLLFCFVVAALADTDTFVDEIGVAYVVPIMVAFVVVARVGILLFRSAWKYEARSGEEALALDPRPPVVYLRSFAVDDQILATTRSRGERLRAFLMYTVSVSPEQEMAFIMERLGPVVAIGKPGERLPELGAARLYVGDDEWRAVVGKLMNDATLVVIRAGDTANLWWEIEEAMTRCSPERIVIMAVGKPRTLAAFERRFAEAFGTPAGPAPPAPRSRVLARLLELLFPHGYSFGKIIYFDRQGKPHEQPLWFRLTWSGIVLSPYRPYRDSLQAAFRIVFRDLGLPSAAKRGLTTAVLLALFGGWLGLHHFYMGQRRKGIWYLASSGWASR